MPKLARPREILSVRSLTKADLARLHEPRKKVTIQKLKDSHHYLARLFASGLNIADVARRTGFGYQRVHRQYASPAFQQLVAEYRKVVNENWAATVDDFFEIATSNMLRAELQIAERVSEAEEAGETLPIRDLHAISRDAADRFGYGKRQTNVNVNADFASLLEKAIRRSGKGPTLVASKTIEGNATSRSQPTLVAGPPLAAPVPSLVESRSGVTVEAS